MQKIIASLACAFLFSGCAVDYEATNCTGGINAYCNQDHVAYRTTNGSGTQYEIKNSILYIRPTLTSPAEVASKELLLDFVLKNPGHVALYDPVLNLATIHREVYDYQDSQSVMGALLRIVGTAAVIAIAVNHRSCFDRHIARYRNHSRQTQKNIFNSDYKGVGSQRWTRDIDQSQDNALKELRRAYECLT